MWWVTTQKNGASALGLQRVLGLNKYETAWTMLHKLRRAMVRPGRDLLTGRVEVDECYSGGLAADSDCIPAALLHPRFVERFGHISVLGMPILVATLILAGNRRAKLPQQIAIACLAVLVCIYYVFECIGGKDPCER
jgi:hypothetical protein